MCSVLIKFKKKVFKELDCYWVKHICLRSMTINGSDNGLSPVRHQAIILTNAGILSIGPLGANFHELLFEIEIFSFKKMHSNMSSGK